MKKRFLITFSLALFLGFTSCKEEDTSPNTGTTNNNDNSPTCTGLAEGWTEEKLQQEIDDCVMFLEEPEEKCSCYMRKLACEIEFERIPITEEDDPEGFAKAGQFLNECGF